MGPRLPGRAQRGSQGAALWAPTFNRTTRRGGTAGHRAGAARRVAAMRMPVLLLLLAPGSASAYQYFGPEYTRAPLNEVHICDDDPNTQSHEACGPAVPNRAVFTTDLCKLQLDVDSGRVDLMDALRGQTVDIILVPEEDAATLTGTRSEPRGDLTFAGSSIVGDVLQRTAERGGFRFNAIVVKPPGAAYDGSWTRWMADWTNRADLVAAWMYETSKRLETGIDFPCARPAPFERESLKRAQPHSNVKPQARGVIVARASEGRSLPATNNTTRPALHLSPARQTLSWTSRPRSSRGSTCRQQRAMIQTGSPS